MARSRIHRVNRRCQMLIQQIFRIGVYHLVGRFPASAGGGTAPVGVQTATGAGETKMQMKTVALALALVSSVIGQSSSSYRITQRYALGGDGSWDYIVPDPPHHRLFIARQNRVMVVDEESGKLLGEVTGIQGAHGTAVAESSGRGFATSGNDDSVVMFDLKTFKVLGRIPAAEDADAIIYDSLEPCLHLEWRRPLLDRDRSQQGKNHEPAARGKARIRRVGGRWQGLRQPHRYERGCGDRRETGR